VIASLLWPVTVAVALKWLMMVDDEAARQRHRHPDGLKARLYSIPVR
jgi:hypothetical protein